MKAVALVAVVSLLTGVPANPNSPEDAMFVGCYLTSSAVTQASKVKPTLTWKQCLYFCDHRKTKYSGVQTELSSLYNLCYCSDNFDFTAKVNNSLCQPCEDDTEKFCGGNQTMSVYQLYDSQSITLLLATKKGAMLLTENLLTNLGGPKGPFGYIDYNYEMDTITYQEGKHVLSFNYNPYLMRYDGPTYTVNTTDRMFNMAVDWTHNNSYLYCLRYSCVNTKVLADGILQQTNMHIIFVQEIAFDPLRRLLFCSSTGKLSSYSLESGTSIKYFSETQTSQRCHRIALDVVRPLFYTICKVHDGNHTLWSMDYDNKNIQPLFNGPQLSTPVAFDVYGDEVVWVNFEEQRPNRNESKYVYSYYQTHYYVLYRCKLTPECLVQNLETISQLKEDIYDLKIYHPQVLHMNPCASRNCSYDCTVISPDEGKCTCPETLILGADEMTCQDPNPFPVGSTITKDVKLVGAETTEADVTSTKETERLEYVWTEDTSLEFPSSTILSDQEDLDYTELPSYTGTVPSETITETTNTKYQPKSENMHPVTLTRTIKIFVLIVVVLIVSLSLAGLIYLIIRKKRNEGDSGLNYVADSEMEVRADTSDL